MIHRLRSLRTFWVGVALWGLSLPLLVFAGYQTFTPGQGASQLRSAGQEPGTRLEDYGAAPDFDLTDQRGRAVSTETLRGKASVANFIYTSCPDTCPLLSLRMQNLQDRLRREALLGTRVQLLSFTVDPARDTPAELAEYAARYQADPDSWRFLSGSEVAVKRTVVEGFQLGITPVPLGRATFGATDSGAAPTRYDVMHSNRFVLTDPQVRIRAYYDGTDLDIDQLVRDIRQVLR